MPSSALSYCFLVVSCFSILIDSHFFTPFLRLIRSFFHLSFCFLLSTPSHYSSFSFPPFFFLFPSFSPSGDPRAHLHLDNNRNKKRMILHQIKREKEVWEVVASTVFNGSILGRAPSFRLTPTPSYSFLFAVRPPHGFPVLSMSKSISHFACLRALEESEMCFT